MKFRLLGPLEVIRNGERLPLGAAQQRALLAVLLLHRREAVTVDRLVDALWGERAPATATKTIQVYVSRLRKVLGAETIVSEGRGYRLAVPLEDVDADRFERLVGEGREALTGGDCACARERLGSALSIWRGEPLADFAYEPFAQDPILALREARLATLEDRIEADLAVGEAGRLVAELQSLIAANPLRERLRGQLMVALYRAGRQADALAVYRSTSDLLRDELGLEPGPSLRGLERSILEHDAGLSAVDGHPGTREVCPFKGLAFFDRADAEYFHGRERLVSDLLARLVEQSLVGILGPSGAGKSSLLRAGVLAGLGEGRLPGSAGWRQVMVRPGEHPCAELERALGGLTLAETLERLRCGERIVVAVDQLEELFTACHDATERASFLEQLTSAAQAPDRRALVIVSLRADFYGRLASYTGFARGLSASHLLVGPMTEAELRQAIEQPAVRAKLHVEPSLVDALVSDVAGEPGGLPLLSTTLLELWRGRDGDALSHNGYRVSGGVRGAVARLAETAYAGLDEHDRTTARRVMLRLAGGDPDALTRRRVPRSELEQIEGAAPIVAALADARLVTIGDDGVELSHEALMREWPRYRAWLDEDRAGRRLHAHLTASAREWERARRDPAELYRGAKLDGALGWTADHDDILSALERDFVRSSRSAAERHTRRLRIQLLGAGLLLIVAVAAGTVALLGQRSARHEARTALARQIGAEAVTEPRLDVAMLLARAGVDLGRSPETEASLLTTLQRNPRVIRAFALPFTLAPQLTFSPNGHTLLASRSRPNLYGRFSSCACLGYLGFYDPWTHARRRPGLTDFFGAQPPAYSADGALLAYPTDSTRPTLAVRRAGTLALLARLAFDPFQITVDVAHARVLVSSGEHVVYCIYRVFAVDRVSSRRRPAGTFLARWSLPSGRRLSTTRIGSAPVLGARLIDAGSRLIVVEPRAISVLDGRSSQRLRTVAITPALRAATAVAIGPGGRVVAIGSRTGRVAFVDASTGRARVGVGLGAGAVADLAYAPDGRSVVSTADDDDVIVWNPRTARVAQTFTTQAEQVENAAFSPDSSTLYTSSVGGVVLAWDLTGRRSFQRRSRLGPASPCCATIAPPGPPLTLSPDGTRFAVRLGTSTVGVFSTATMRRVAAFSISPQGTLVTALAWSPTRSELAVGGEAGHVQLWSVSGAPRPLHSLAGFTPIDGLPEAVDGLAFSPDGRQLAAANSSESLQAPGAGDLSRLGSRLSTLAIWNAGDGQLLGAPRDLGPGPAHDVGALAFSSDGRFLAVSVPDVSNVLNAGVMILDTATGRVRRTLHPVGGADDGTPALAFSPRGVLATGSAEGILQLWNPTTGRQVAGLRAVDTGPVTSVAFDATGRRLATAGGRDGTVKLWFTTSLRQEGTAFRTDPGAPARVAFNPRAGSLLAVDTRGRAFAWPVSLAEWERRACAIAGRNLTRSEWSELVSGASFARVCGS